MAALVIIVFIAIFFVVWLVGAGAAVRRARKHGQTLEEPIKPEADNQRHIRGSSVDESASVVKNKNVQTDQRIIALGGVTIPKSCESEHILFAGTTGTGKTQGISRVLRTVQSRGSRAMIADAGGEYLSRFYREGDLIFNPFDRRSVDWSPFAEIRREYDPAAIAKAAIPDVPGESSEWHHYAQVLLGEVMLVLYKLKLHSIKQLMYYMTTAERVELGEFIADTPAAMLCREGNERMLANTRGIISTFLTSWRYLSDRGSFSIREWVRTESGSNWIYIVYRDDQFTMIRSLVSAVMELGFVEGLNLPINPERDLWFVMDEVDSLGKVTSLSHGLPKFRKYGCKCVLGLQTISQLRSTYGSDEAQTLMANISTKVVFRPGDGETAEYFSKEFGDQEIERNQASTGLSASLRNGRTRSQNTTVVRETKRTILGAELTALENLNAYLRYPGSLTKITLDYEKYPEITGAFVERI
jgi:type IV secretory pathway TraG/TraD family ATPase VirD4